MYTKVQCRWERRSPYKSQITFRKGPKTWLFCLCFYLSR